MFNTDVKQEVYLNLMASVCNVRCIYSFIMEHVVHYIIPCSENGEKGVFQFLVAISESSQVRVTEMIILG